MKEDIQKSKTYEEKKASLLLYGQWKNETFWMIFQHNAVRAFGFCMEEVCNR